jgi:hypothetical protein
LQRKATTLGATPSAGPDLRALLDAWLDQPSAAAAGALLWAAVAAMRAHDVDAEAALRATARAFRDQLIATEQSDGG